ncbi:MAG: hypothetical protein L6R36_007045 [Xanthoria steineri]|nr:MAG: hypothetical protein L6R36_007045 [Xanthoria steineri]
MESDSLSAWTVEMEEGKSGTSTTAEMDVDSSQSAQRPIPPNEETKVFSWADVRDIVETNRLDLIRRKPSERVVYKAWCKDIIAAYGSITAYMCAERLRWSPLPDAETSGPVFDYCDPTPFADPRDFRILRNDWPYGSFGPEITHLIVWSKPRIATDPENGLVTPESRKLIDAFVNRTFVQKLELDGSADAVEKVLWFKNWGALQSVRGLEHIHVLVKDVPEAIIEEWTDEMRSEL